MVELKCLPVPVVGLAASELGGKSSERGLHSERPWRGDSVVSPACRVAQGRGQPGREEQFRTASGGALSRQRIVESAATPVQIGVLVHTSNLAAKRASK